MRALIRAFVTADNLFRVVVLVLIFGLIHWQNLARENTVTNHSQIVRTREEMLAIFKALHQRQQLDGEAITLLFDILRKEQP